MPWVSSNISVQRWESKSISLRDSQQGTSRLRGFEASCRYPELSFLFRREGHFHKKHENRVPKMENAGKIMSDTSKYCQHEVVCIKITSKWCRIQHQSRPRKPPVAIIHIFASFFAVQPGGHVADKRGNDRTTKRYGRQTWSTQALFGSFRRRKSEICH